MVSSHFSKPVESKPNPVLKMVKDKKGSVAGGKGKSMEVSKEESKCICEICTCG